LKCGTISDTQKKFPLRVAKGKVGTKKREGGGASALVLDWVAETWVDKSVGSHGIRQVRLQTLNHPANYSKK